MSGLPVTQVPLGLSREGLPVGLQVVGAPYQDHLTIAVAAQLERGLGGGGVLPVGREGGEEWEGGPLREGAGGGVLPVGREGGEEWEGGPLREGAGGGVLPVGREGGEEWEGGQLREEGGCYHLVEAKVGRRSEREVS